MHGRLKEHATEQERGIEEKVVDEEKIGLKKERREEG